MHVPTPEDLKERRNAIELTQRELADRAGVSQPLIARIEGDDVDPRLSTVRTIVRALDRAEGEVVRAADVMNDAVAHVAPDDPAVRARDLMLDAGYSQLPVIRDGRPVGVVTNSDVRHAREQRTVGIEELPVAELMREGVTTVEPDATLEEVDSHLDHTPAVLVVSGGNVVGIITEADVAARVR